MTFSPSAYLLNLAQNAQDELGRLVDSHFERLRDENVETRTAAEADINAGVVRLLLNLSVADNPPHIPAEALGVTMALHALLLKPGSQPELETALGRLALSNSERVSAGLGAVKAAGVC